MHHILSGRPEEHRQAQIQMFPQKSLTLLHPVELGRGYHCCQEQSWKKEAESSDSVKVGVPSCWPFNFIRVTPLPSLFSV